MNSLKVCEYSRSRSFHDDLILQDQASGERSQDQWSSGLHLQKQKLDADQLCSNCIADLCLCFSFTCLLLLIVNTKFQAYSQLLSSVTVQACLCQTWVETQRLVLSFELHREKTRFLPLRKQRRRSASL